MPEVVEQQQDSEAAFSAGFDNAPAPAAPETSPAETAATPEATPAAEPAVPQLIAGMSEADWNAAVAKATTPLLTEVQNEIRKNFGQVGEVNRALSDIKKQLAAGGPASRKITAEMLKRVNEELPGFGDALAADLSEIMGSPAVAAEAAQAQAAAEAKGQTFDSEKFFAEKIGPALESLEARNNERAELRIVKSIHRDFDAVTKSPEFSAWLGSLPPERKKFIRDSEDGFVAADAVTEFKTAQDKLKKDGARNKSRLEGAITPQGSSQPQSHVNNDEEAAFSAGFSSVR